MHARWALSPKFAVLSLSFYWNEQKYNSRDTHFHFASCVGSSGARRTLGDSSTRGRSHVRLLGNHGRWKHLTSFIKVLIVYKPLEKCSPWGCDAPWWPTQTHLMLMGMCHCLAFSRESLVLWESESAPGPVNEVHAMCGTVFMWESTGTMYRSVQSCFLVW